MSSSAEREDSKRRLTEQEIRLNKIAANYQRLDEELAKLETDLSNCREIQSDNRELTQQKPK